MRKRHLSVGTVMASLLLYSLPGQAQDTAGSAEAGRTIFNRQCQVCHAVQEGQNKVGPSLAGIVGRKSAEAPKFNYSPAMKGADKTWDAETLDAYLADPRGYIPGSRMIYAGLKDAKQRADVIAYLGTLK
ncbi:c-type cytochrome [Teichococcus oryzae]|uniref:Cytochrome c family protein n=1 Tax=Teichococcus oryzae TaxID=1608942 RepID=A0A5B2TG98_9PROT|nr:cytochrome c family protein [Pseudoroseomonas oryzae]KAA2213511.1 cytochrome c family protein [Pseudoroseomonas oryzae]